MKNNNPDKFEELATQVIAYARNSLFINLRFMENALCRLKLKPYENTISSNGVYLFYNPKYVLKEYKKSTTGFTRKYLHTVLHCVFQHSFVAPSINIPVWNVACDIAVAEMINELDIKCVEIENMPLQKMAINKLRKNLNLITAEKIYHYLIENKTSDNEISSLQKIFNEDDHSMWYIYEFNEAEAMSSRDGMTEADIKQEWNDISHKLQTDLETFSKNRGRNSGSMLQNLKAVNREKCDYREFLKKFSVYGEVMKVDEDSFDYNFYCHGLSVYKNVVIVEPLEYKDVQRIKEFVIAIDTSASVRNEIVQTFIQKTFNILKQEENFFSKVNIHIIQCDETIQEDVCITSQEDFDRYMVNFSIKGLGGTDFRPVFDKIDNMIANKEFKNLKGMIYFTDGCGVFPDRQPEYQTAFVFLDDNYNNFNVPVWAIKVVLGTDSIKEDF